MIGAFTNESAYYLLVDQQQHGPYALDQLQDFWRKGIVVPDTLFWTQGQTGWEPLRKISAYLDDLPTKDLRNLLPPRVDSPSPARIVPAVPNPTVPPATKTAGLAIGSLACGIAGVLLGLPALLAIIFGHLARGKIKKSQGALKGSGLALAGLILGYVVLGVFVGISGLVAFADRHHGPELKDLENARQIAAAVRFYSQQHGGRTPPDLEALVPNYFPSNAALVSPLSPDPTSAGYELALPNTDLSTVKDPTHTILLQGRYKSARGYRVYVYADGYGTAKHE